QTLGRLAARVSRILTGKDSPKYTPFLDTGDHVIVVNAAKVRITGLKGDHKLYFRHTGFPGGIRSEAFRKRIARRPEAIVRDAIMGMLPHTKLGRAMADKLRVYRSEKHPHQAQQPQPLAVSRRV
ncbi:MAG: 50S ribosomal protein L13, partial [Terriglobales bacterium]